MKPTIPIAEQYFRINDAYLMNEVEKSSTEFYRRLNANETHSKEKTMANSKISTKIGQSILNVMKSN